MKRILIVEDNEMNRDVLSRRLARRGYDVLLAADGPHGLAMAATQRPGPDPDGPGPAGDRRLGVRAAAEGRRRRRGTFRSSR